VAARSASPAAGKVLAGERTGAMAAGSQEHERKGREGGWRARLAPDWFGRRRQDFFPGDDGLLESYEKEISVFISF
jgi:hypothetical protein